MIHLGAGYNNETYPKVEKGFGTPGKINFYGLEGKDIEICSQVTRKIVLIDMQGNKILMRESGGQYWADRIHTKYAEPQYRMGYIKDGKYFEYMRVLYNKQTTKKGKELALQMFKEYCEQ